MDLLSIWHDYRYCSKIYSALSLPYNLQVKVTDRNFMLKFYLRAHKIFYLLSYFSNHTIYIWYTDSSYGRCSSKIISNTMSSSLPPHTHVPTPLHTHTHIHINYDQDFKVIVLIFYWLISASSGELSCLATGLVLSQYEDKSITNQPIPFPVDIHNFHALFQYMF